VIGALSHQHSAFSQRNFTAEDARDAKEMKAGLDEALVLMSPVSMKASLMRPGFSWNEPS
jgi:hypothetical protein